MDFLSDASGKTFALYAGLAALCAALSLYRDRRPGQGAALFSGSVLAALGLVALFFAFSVAAPSNLIGLSGALLVTGLAIVALAPRPRGRRSPGRQVGSLIAWLAILLAIGGAFLSPGATPNVPA